MKPEKKTLVIQPLPGIGDMIWHLKLLKAIACKAPSRKISILTKPSSFTRDLIGHEDFVDQILDLEPRYTSATKIFSLAKNLGRIGFHESWCLHHSFKFPLASFLAGIPHRYGYGLGWGQISLNKGIFLKAAQKSLTPFERTAFFARLNALPLEDKDQRLTPQKEALAFVRQFLKNDPTPWIALGIGASQEFKSWSTQNFISLIQSIERKHTASFFLLGSKKDRPKAEAIKASFPSSKTNLAVLTDFQLCESIAFLSLCRGFIGNDSGLLNVAANVGIPSLGLFGATDVLDYSPHLHAITPPVLFSGMNKISPQMVLEGFQKAKIFP